MGSTSLRNRCSNPQYERASSRSGSARQRAARMTLCGFASLLGASASADAFGLFSNNGLSGGFRWDAAPLTLNGRERSLDGGLRYSLQGGSFQAYRDLFTWQGSPPSVASFQTAVVNSFNAWSVVDPATGVGSDLSFIANLATPVSTAVSNGVRLGAEVDLLASIDGGNWNPGSTGTQAE